MNKSAAGRANKNQGTRLVGSLVGSASRSKGRGNHRFVANNKNSATSVGRGAGRKRINKGLQLTGHFGEDGATVAQAENKSAASLPPQRTSQGRKHRFPTEASDP